MIKKLDGRSPIVQRSADGGTLQMDVGFGAKLDGMELSSLVGCMERACLERFSCDGL